MHSRPDRRRRAAAVCAVAILALLAGCLDPPAGSTPPPLTPDSGRPVARADELGELERHARRVTLRVRNLGCDRIALGSGFAIGPDLLVTNRHVVVGAERLEVNTWDGQRLSVAVARAATSHDLALVRVADGTLPAVADVAERDPEAGEEVVVASHPGGGELVVRHGRVRGATADRLFNAAAGAVALDVPLEPGSSGGPVLDRDGLVVGIVYAVAVDGDTSYAVPASALRAVDDADLVGDLPPCPD
jgi:S1-C subfamily serine protease